MVVHLFLALTVSIRWRLLFPTVCWSINTKSIGTTNSARILKFHHQISKQMTAVCVFNHLCDQGRGYNLGSAYHSQRNKLLLLTYLYLSIAQEIAGSIPAQNNICVHEQPVWIGSGWVFSVYTTYHGCSVLHS
jgi:hypothetical protein